MVMTLEQKIEKKQNELNQLKIKNRKLQTKQKIIIGAITINAIFNDLDFKKLFLKKIQNIKLTQNDFKTIQPILEN